MSIHDLAYVEVYVADLKEATSYLVDAVGFTTIAAGSPATGLTGRRSTVLRAGTADIVLTTPDTSAPVSAFLDRHGDGIADIALTCSDVERVRGLARAAGFTDVDGDEPGFVVPELGSVRHSLVGLDHDWSRRSGFEPVAPVRSAVRKPPAHIDHLALCLRRGELEAARESYRRLGFSPFFSEYIEFGGQAMDSVVVRSQTGGATLTMVAPDGDHVGQLEDFLAANGGPGVQHVALSMKDVVAAVDELRSRHVRLLPAPAAYYEVLAQRDTASAAEAAELRGTGILADADEFGELRQIFGGSPYPRDTLFYEFIERRGAQSFGTRNIRALYEAKDADVRVAR
ncbi:MAG: 4-hydroxymandelate synthase [Actinoplanes sp.]|nr:4-hydroxymandelate synthase [Actinoplanes sp.]